MMLSYAKFWKDMPSKKRRFQENAMVLPIEKCGAILQHRLSPQLKYPGYFSITCSMGDIAISWVLYNLGASVSLRPYSICKRLQVRDLKTHHNLYLTCGSLGEISNKDS